MSSDRMRIDVDLVCFDYWNTLIHESRPGALVDARVPAIRGFLAEGGHIFSMDELRSLHAIIQAEFEYFSANGVIYETLHAARKMAELLELPDGSEHLIDKGFTLGSAGADVLVVDGVPAALEVLRAFGVATAIVCDVGLTPSSVLVEWLETQGLASYFDAMAFSDQIGEYKPGRRMFDWVMSEIGCRTPKRVVHVGDRRRTDVAGARSCGFRSVRFMGVFDDQAELAEAEAVIEHMPDLLDLLFSRNW